MGNIGTGRSLESYGRVQDCLVRTAALIDQGGIDVRLEGRSDLSQGLSGAIELGEIKVASTDHGLDLAGGVVDGNQRPLSAGVLLEAYFGSTPGVEREHFDIDDVSDCEQGGQLAPGPGDVGLRKRRRAL